MAPAKEARMACTVSGETAFIKQQEILRDRCSKALADHLKENPDVVWTPKDGRGERPSSSEEAAKLKLVVDVEFDEETGQPDFPPGNNRLSDELVYLVTKFMNARDLGRRYPYDFDKMGNINPQRVPSGPAPIIWAHGLPFFPVYKGYYILCGRAHAGCIGWLLHEKTGEIMQANPIWSVGAVVAPDSAVKAPRNITRQMTQHKPSGSEKNPGYRGKAWARDVVAAEHHLCAVFPNLDSDEIEVCPMWNSWGYNVRCGPMRSGVKPTTMPKDFFTSHGIKNIDYESLARPYGNHLMDEDEDSDDKDDPDGDVEVIDRAGESVEDASGSNQPIMTQSASQMDVDMNLVSLLEVTKQVPAQSPGQHQEQVPEEQDAVRAPVQSPAAAAEKIKEGVKENVKEEAKEEVNEEAMEKAIEVPVKQVTEETAKDSEIAPSDLEEKQLAVSNSTVDTELAMMTNIGDSIEQSNENPAPEQTSTAPVLLAETTIQATAIVQPIEVQPKIKQSEIEHAVTGTSDDNTHTIEPLKVEQIAPDQPGTEQLDQTAASVLPEDLKVAGVPASNKTDASRSQAPAEVPM
ncbi:uncharacterized protein N7525_000358 [Penicillium rubens]|jgi:hypothetical protein|nr:uncharacterized protein N7525_000358 [Penicillium rubens]KAJ5842617.1 hypothetical protein N7525_000358 [Penicillium rubens]KAJ5846812.1 hypothetical protein N7534_010481 [Penicillium rubens]